MTRGSGRITDPRLPLEGQRVRLWGRSGRRSTKPTNRQKRPRGAPWGPAPPSQADGQASGSRQGLHSRAARAPPRHGRQRNATGPRSSSRCRGPGSGWARLSRSGGRTCTFAHTRSEWPGDLAWAARHAREPARLDGGYEQAARTRAPAAPGGAEDRDAAPRAARTPALRVLRQGGTPLDTTNADKAFKRVLKDAELPLHFTPHCLRHTFASLLLQQGESPTYVQRQLGHASIQLTVDTYGRWLPMGNEAAVDRLDDASKGGSGSKVVANSAFCGTGA